MITATAVCSSANRTAMQESVVFRTPPTPPAAPALPGKPAAPAVPKPAVFQGTILIFDPSQMGQYIPGQTYTIDVGK